MTKERVKNIALIVVFVLFIVITYNVVDLKKQVNRLENNLATLSELQNQIGSIRNDIASGYSDIQQKLKEEQSLFSETSVNIQLQDKKIAVTMQAIPKEIRNDEKLIARITTNNKVYEQEADKNNTSVIVVDMTDTIKPMFIIQSDNGVKQEVLPEYSTKEFFTCDIFTEWDEPSMLDDQAKLTLWIVSPERGLPFSKSDVQKAEFVILESSESEITEEYWADDAEEYSITAEGISSEERKLSLGYTADFTEFADKQDGKQYEIYFVLTLKSGIKYISLYNSVASLSSYDNGGSKGCGSDIISPVFE